MKIPYHNYLFHKENTKTNLISSDHQFTPLLYHPIRSSIHPPPKIYTAQLPSQPSALHINHPIISPYPTLKIKIKSRNSRIHILHVSENIKKTTENAQNMLDGPNPNIKGMTK